MRNLMIVLWMLLCSITTAAGQVSFGIAAPGVSIGINVPVYPELVPVPGYPVYYAPQMNSNYFFYDGMYWVYQRDNWYASSWYNGPWGLVGPEAVPLFVLRVPVRYYRQRPAYFHGWVSDAPPHWGEHWGNTWEQQRTGWNNWDRNSAPAPAPLPVFQRQYSGSRYPHIEQQQALQNQNYHYQPRDAVVQQHYQAAPVQSAVVAAPPVRPAAPQARSNPPSRQRNGRSRKGRRNSKQWRSRRGRRSSKWWRSRRSKRRHRPWPSMHHRRSLRFRTSRRNTRRRNPLRSIRHRNRRKPWRNISKHRNARRRTSRHKARRPHKSRSRSQEKGGDGSTGSRWPEGTARPGRRCADEGAGFERMAHRTSRASPTSMAGTGLGHRHSVLKTQEQVMSLGTILLIVLILILIGVLPTWPHARSWGYGPSGIVGVVLLILIVLFLLGRL